MKKALSGRRGAARSLIGRRAPGADITIATAGPMTGQYATFGAQMKAGAEQAVDDINAAGGVLGEQLVLRSATTLRSEAGGGGRQPASPAAAPSSWPATSARARRSRPRPSMPRKASSRSRRPRPTRPSPTSVPARASIRVCGRDDQQGQVAGAYLAENFADEKVAILHDKSAYGKGLADETQKAMDAAGKKPTSTRPTRPARRTTPRSSPS